MTAPVPRIQTNCLACKQPILVTQKRLDSGRGRFCSRACGARHHSLRHGHTTHVTHSRTYTSWNMMRQRCENPNAPNFPNYGGRGISVCERWRTFENFAADMGERPKGTSLDRINSDDGYHPANCRWATPKQQQSNLRNNNLVQFSGESIPLSALARKLGLRKNTLRYRLAKGWSEDDLAKPAGVR